MEGFVNTFQLVAVNFRRTNRSSRISVVTDLRHFGTGGL